MPQIGKYGVFGIEKIACRVMWCVWVYVVLPIIFRAFLKELQFFLLLFLDQHFLTIFRIDVKLYLDDIHEED